MSPSGFNLVSYEKFDEALNLVSNLSGCNISNAVNVLNNSGNLPSAYSEISNGITDIKSAISRLANGEGPEKLIENYVTGYNEIKNQIINAYIAEYEFALENGNIDEALNQFGKIDKDAFKTEISEMLKKMNDKNNAENTLLQYSSLAEFFKEMENTFSKYSVKLDDASNGIANLLPKNNRDIAHRGYLPGKYGDNSAESFILAGEKGFWGCEADVRFDANGNLVCSHNSVKSGENPTTFEEYLDICKKYGMTAIIDLKYENGPNNADENLSTSILKTIKDKGMMDSCVLQTNNSIDIAYIRENSNDARIWYLTDSITDKNVELIQNNNVECVNILSSDNNSNKIKKLTENGIDVCVWNVQSEESKVRNLNIGATYVMTDNLLGITPYKEGEPNMNDLKFNLNEQIDPILLNANIEEFKDDSIKTSTTSSSSDTLTSGVHLTARKGYIDGPEAYETWYDLDMNTVVKNMSELYGYTNVKASIREDGVKVLSGTAPDGTTFENLVMVAADVRHDAANPNGTYERGQVVDTTLGKGIVVDACREAIDKRKNNQGNHFDIATAWHTGEYMKQAYSENETSTLSENNINDLENKVTGIPVDSSTANSQSQTKTEVSNSEISAVPLSSNTNISSESTASNTLSTGEHLTARKGYIDGPEAYETWYDLDMNTVVKNMSELYGYTNVESSIREDGVKVLSGTAPDGTTFENLVMVAADVRHDAANPNGTYERGQVVDTTLGKGIVVDACREAIDKRKNNQGNHFDIATAWLTGEYMEQAYFDNSN